MSADDHVRPGPGQPAAPRELRLDRRDGLHVVWSDGTESHFSLALLREHCPCAACAERKRAETQTAGRIPLKVLPNASPASEAFTEARLVGNYALHIAWADGHTTGFYDFRYLREIDELRKRT